MYEKGIGAENKILELAADIAQNLNDSGYYEFEGLLGEEISLKMRQVLIFVCNPKLLPVIVIQMHMRCPSSLVFF